MQMEYRQDTITSVNDMLAEIRGAAMELRRTTDRESLNVIIDMTYQAANLLQQGTFAPKEAS